MRRVAFSVSLLLVVSLLPIGGASARPTPGSDRFPTALNSTGDTYELQVTASGNPNNVTAVALNVTVVDGEASSVGGYVTVFPCGERPDASNLNFVDGQTVPNAVVAPVSADGRVCFYVYGRAHVLVDVAGYFTSGFTALSRPERMLNTRTSGVKVGELDGSGDPVSLTVVGRQGIPSGVSAVALNVTVVDGEASSVGGYVTVFPCGERPDASNLNFVNGQTVPNAVVAPVSADGRVCFYVYGRAHVLVDVAGYFTSGFTALSRPERMLNTRTSGVKVGTRVAGPVTGGATKSPTGPVALGLDLSGATALIRTSVPTSAQSDESRFATAGPLSNLFKVDGSGQVSSVATSNAVTVGDVVTGPNGKVYTLPLSGECRLAETDPTTNASICIEAANTIWQSWEMPNHPRIQFDADGGVYYAVTERGRMVGGSWCPGETATVRRYKGGQITEMFRIDGQTVRFWSVARNGSVIFSGQKFSIQGECVELDYATKMVTSDRELLVISPNQTWFFSDFGTSSVFYGLCGPGECGHRRYDAQTGTSDPVWHLIGFDNGWSNPSSATGNNSADPICRAHTRDTIGEFCSVYGTTAGPFSHTTSGKYYAKIEAVMSPYPSTHPSPVFQYYPTVQPVLGTLVRSRTIETIGNDLFLAGRDSAGNFSTVRIDTVTGLESTVIPVSAGYDVVQLEGDAAQGRLYFRGSQVSGGTEVFGYVTLSTGAITIKQVAGATVVDVDPMVTV